MQNNFFTQFICMDVWWSRFITFSLIAKIKLVEKFGCVGRIFDVKFNSIYVWYI